MKTFFTPDGNVPFGQSSVVEKAPDLLAENVYVKILVSTICVV